MSTGPWRWMGRHKALTGIVACLAVLGLAAGGFALWVNSRIGDIPRIDLGLAPAEGAESGEGVGTDVGAPGKALNILLMGTDGQDPGALAAMVESGWQPGVMRSDTLMVLHLSADRSRASLISIPRDTWIDVPGHGWNKINAAFSYGGPKLALDTVEDVAGIQVDHVAIVDWEGFKDISTALGGVEVTIPETVAGSNGTDLWEEGTTTLEGEAALDYVRERYNLPNGDFDRIARQQNFLRALVGKLLDTGTFTNPIRLANTVDAVVPHLTVDTSLDTGRLRDLAFSLRHLDTRDLTFTTVPLDAYAVRGGGQSVVLVDLQLVKEMFDAADEERLPEFLARRDVAQLPGPDQVS